MRNWIDFNSITFIASKKLSPSIIFIDEVDRVSLNGDQSSHGSGDQMLGKLLQQMDGVTVCYSLEVNKFIFFSVHCFVRSHVKSGLWLDWVT